MFGRCVCLKPFRIPEKSSGVGKHMANLKTTHLRHHSSWKKKNKLALNCMLNKNHDRPKCCHPSMAIFPKSKGLGNWVQVNERGMRVIHPKFCSDVILENQHQENQSFETVGIIDLRLIRLHWQIISLAFPAFCEKIDFPTFPAQFPKMAPFVASPVISAFPAWPETLL